MRARATGFARCAISRRPRPNSRRAARCSGRRCLDARCHPSDHEEDVPMRPVIAELPGSKIREVANAGLGRNDVLPFWFGESDEATPDFIREAAVRSLHDGETFYAHNLGLPELRAALSGYVSALHGPVAA